MLASAILRRHVPMGISDMHPTPNRGEQRVEREGCFGGGGCVGTRTGMSQQVGDVKGSIYRRRSGKCQARRRM